MINYDRINAMIGKPWVYLKNDCWAVLKIGSREIFGVEINDKISFPETSDNKFTDQAIELERQSNAWVKTATPGPGDAIVFKDHRGLSVHVGLYVENGNILHCFGGQNVKNGKTRYDSLKTIARIYKSYESYKYAGNSS